MIRPLPVAVVAALSCALFACSSVTQDARVPCSETGARASPSQAWAIGERLGADTPARTVEGNAFIAPAGWRLSVRGPASLLEAPEGGSHIALVDVRAASADEAVGAAWQAYEQQARRPLLLVRRLPDAGRLEGGVQ